MFVRSTAKWLILKYSGLRGHGKAAKLSIGLILGDLIVDGLWNIIGVVFNTPTYSFWPGSCLS